MTSLHTCSSSLPCLLCNLRDPSSLNKKLQRYEEAVQDLSLAAMLVPEDKDVAGELSRAKRTQEALKRKERRTYTKMFS